MGVPCSLEEWVRFKQHEQQALALIERGARLALALTCLKVSLAQQRDALGAN